MKSLAAAFVLATPCLAQVTLQVGPDPAPLGGPVIASVTNDTTLIMSIGGCPWRVLDDQGQEVFAAECLIQELLVGTLGTVNYVWDQTDQLGVPVPAGTYSMEVLTAIGKMTTPIQVGGVDANLHLKGTPAIGTDWIGFGGRQVALVSPQDPGGLYVLLASAPTGVGTPTCGGVVPLVQDALFNLSAAGAVFANSVGLLDASGYSDAPLLPIPDDPALVGFDLQAAFVVVDTGSACPIQRVSEALVLEITSGAIGP